MRILDEKRVFEISFNPFSFRKKSYFLNLNLVYLYVANQRSRSHQCSANHRTGSEGIIIKYQKRPLLKINNISKHYFLKISMQCCPHLRFYRIWCVESWQLRKIVFSNFLQIKWKIYLTLKIPVKITINILSCISKDRQIFSFVHIKKYLLKCSNKSISRAENSSQNSRQLRRTSQKCRFVHIHYYPRVTLKIYSLFF